MTNIKIHQCPSCGGNLAVDNERQMYHCSFCGSSFDYEYFREEQAHEMGEKYLSRGEYSAAKDIYKFVLDKDPHDFEALRGLMLTSARLKEMGDIYAHIGVENFSYDKNQVESVCGSASSDDKEYFDTMSKIYSDMKELSDLVEDKNKLRGQRRKLEDKIHLENQKREECDVKDRYGTPHDPVTTFITTSTIAGLLNLLIVILVVIGIFTEDWVVGVGLTLLLISLPLTIIDFVIVYPRFKSAREIDAKINEYSNESGILRLKIHDMDEKIDKDSTSIKQACTAFVRKDKKIMAELK